MSEQYLNTKKEYIAVDFAKFVAALFVVAIHIPPFKDVAPGFSYEFQQVFCRMAVPFFFLCTGFFVGEKVQSWGKIKSYLLHIIKMYTIWTLFYFYPMLERFWMPERAVSQNVLELLQRFFLIGSYIQLWYLQATIVAVVLLFLCTAVCRMRERTVVVFALVIYLVGVLGNSYRHAFDGMPAVVTLIRQYQSLFFMTRNGVFFGFPFVTAGYLIFMHRDKIRQRAYAGMAVVFLTGMFLEERLVNGIFGGASHDMYLLTPAVAISLFLAIVFIPMPQSCRQTGKLLRSISTYIFLLHILINFYLKKLLLLVNLKMDYSLTHYTVITVLSIAAGALIYHIKGKNIKKV